MAGAPSPPLRKAGCQEAILLLHRKRDNAVGGHRWSTLSSTSRPSTCRATAWTGSPPSPSPSSSGCTTSETTTFENAPNASSTLAVDESPHWQPRGGLRALVGAVLAVNEHGRCVLPARRRECHDDGGHVEELGLPAFCFGLGGGVGGCRGAACVRNAGGGCAPDGRQVWKVRALSMAFARASYPLFPCA